MESKERQLYSRHAMLEGWDQELIKNSVVFQIGVGALGCEIAKNLALTGIGKIILVDDDTIETSNLSRQMLFWPGDEGRPKAEVAAERLKKFNPFMEVEYYFTKLQEVPIPVYEKSDIIIGGLDNIKARLDLNDICLRLKKPLIDSGTLGFEGHVHLVLPEGSIPSHEFETPCLRCLLPVPPADEKLIAACTPKGIPKKREHCVLRAEYFFAKEYNRSPNLKDPEDVKILVKMANKDAENWGYSPTFVEEDMENILKNKMPAIQTVNAVISSIQSHEVLKILHLLKGKNIGLPMTPPYLNYNGVYGLIEYIDIGKWEDCPACGKGQEIRQLNVNPSGPVLDIFEGLKQAGFDLNPNVWSITREISKKIIYNPYIPNFNDLTKNIIDSGVLNHDVLLLVAPKQEPLKILVDFLKEEEN
ncbi:MAG: HesA/MoeB/ThiF family protein [Candidatus Helarchaeota archaeon]